MRAIQIIMSLSLLLGASSKKPSKSKRDAVVTLVAGEANGYDGGAIALGQSLINVGSKLHRVLLVDPDV